MFVLQIVYSFIAFCLFFKEHLGMISCVEAFLVYHAAACNSILPEHLNFENVNTSNFIAEDLSSEKEQQKKLITIFSQEQDWILDINSKKGTKKRI